MRFSSPASRLASLSPRHSLRPPHDGEPDDVRVVLPCRRRFGLGLLGAPRVREVRLVSDDFLLLLLLSPPLLSFSLFARFNILASRLAPSPPAEFGSRQSRSALFERTASTAAFGTRRKRSEGAAQLGMQSFVEEPERAPLRRLFSSVFSSRCSPPCLVFKLSTLENSLGLPLAPLLQHRRRASSPRAGPPSSCALPVRDFFSSLLLLLCRAHLSRRRTLSLLTLSGSTFTSVACLLLPCLDVFAPRTRRILTRIDKAS